ncbi:MAG: hypothetical protein ABEJ31_00800 [Haloarculaceae archaeon]
MFPLAADVTGGGPLALVVTFLLVAAFYAVTLHLAAVFFVGDVPSQRAATVSPAPTVVSLLLQRWGPGSAGVVSPGVGVLVTVLATLAADAVAIAYVYRLRWPSTVALTLLHFAFAAALGLALFNLLG